MGWYSVRYKSFPDASGEYEIEAPSSYEGPVIDDYAMIDELGLLVWGDKKQKRFDVFISHGLLAAMYVGTANDKDTAMLLAKAFMDRYDTWRKVLNYMKKFHGTDLRTLKHSTC